MEEDDYQQKGHWLLRAWLSGALAGTIETALTMPFEVTKTRQQVLQQAGIVRPPTGRVAVVRAGSLGLYGSIRDTVQLGGIRALYSGMPICLLQTSGKVGIRFASFEGYKRLLNRHACSKQERIILAGCLAGATEAAFWITPCERLKVRPPLTSLACCAHWLVQRAVQMQLVVVVALFPPGVSNRKRKEPSFSDAALAIYHVT